MPFTLIWKGAEVRAKVAGAATLGVDATMAEGVTIAKAGHPSYPPSSMPDTPYANRTGFLTGSTTIKAPAVEVGSKIAGLWGSDANYSLYVEIGTSRKDSGAPRAEVRALVGPEIGMWEISYPSPSEHPQMAPRYSLRPAADVAYRGLAGKIALFYASGL